MSATQNMWSGTSSSYGAATNWSAAHVPLAGEDVILASSSQSITSSLDQSAVALSSFMADLSFTGTAGDTGNAYLKINYTGQATLGTNLYPGSSSGSTRLNVNFGTCNGTLSILGSGRTATDTNVSPTRILGSALTVVAVGGTFGFAEALNELCTINAFTAGNPVGNNSVTATMGAGCSHATISQNSGTITSFSTAATTLANVAGGTFVYNGTGAITTLNIYKGGTVQINKACSITALTIYGTLDLSAGFGTVSIAGVTSTYKGAKIIDPLNRASFASGIKLPDGSWKDVSIQYGINRTYTVV